MRYVLAIVLVLLSPRAMAQVVRHISVDPMTDQKIAVLMIPSVDGQAAFILGCRGPAIGSNRLALPSDAKQVLVRFDKRHPEEIPTATSTARGVVLLVPPYPIVAFSAEVAKAERIAVRFEGPPSTDLMFDLSSDNKWAFAEAAEVAGGNFEQAAAGYDTLTENVLRAAAGQNPTVVELFTAIKLDWRKDRRPLDTRLLIRGIMNAIAHTANVRTVEDAGQVLFGYGWSAIRPTALAKGDKAYLAANDTAAHQRNWLDRSAHNDRTRLRASCAFTTPAAHSSWDPLVEPSRTAANILPLSRENDDLTAALHEDGRGPLGRRGNDSIRQVVAIQGAVRPLQRNKTLRVTRPES